MVLADMGFDFQPHRLATGGQGGQGAAGGIDDVTDTTDIDQRRIFRRTVDQPLQTPDHDAALRIKAFRVAA